MEEQRLRLPSFFTKFAGSIREKADSDLNIRCFTERQIKNITDNYNTVLGKGGFSVVYKGRLDDGRPVAVKKYIFTSKEKEFTKEVIIQSQFSHRNIVRLLGCCVEADAPMLVTEFVPNRNLSDLLHGSSAQGPLSLDKRLQIASDVAEALVYMHTSQNHPILHGDIKSENIFLDSNYMPKLSDFGISRFLSVSSDEYTGYVIGSMGYMDPEFCQTGRLSTKSDVYSFGVVLLELMTRIKAIDANKNLLVKTFGLASTISRRHDLFDKDIATTVNMDVLDEIVDLALECVKFELEKRPEMRDVSERLRRIQRPRKAKNSKQTGFKSSIAKFQRTPDEKRRLEVIYSLRQAGFERFITKEQINKMRENYNSSPTKCFMGEIYRGDMKGKHSVVAIIKMSFDVHSGVSEEFSHEMMLHSIVNHCNVVELVGCCLDGNIPILVYESAKASLHDILFGYRMNTWTFNFEERLRVAVSIAEGLDYLHSLGIVHGDVRTTNVLVVNDISKNEFLKNMQIKVSGIGASVYLSMDNNGYMDPRFLSMAKAADEIIKVDERSGYMDPIFLETGILTKMADVYSFGVVLLELFTGKMVSNHIRTCRLEELWDNTDCRHIEGTRTLTFRCLDPSLRRRPKLKEAIELFRNEMDGFISDRCDGLFCNDNCSARMDGCDRFR